MTVLIGVIHVWVIVAVGVALVLIAASNILSQRYEGRLYYSLMLTEDGLFRGWIFPAAVIGFAVPAAVSFPVEWHLNPTERDGRPLHDSAMGVVLDLILTACGLVLAVMVGYIMRTQRRYRQRRRLLDAAVAAHRRGTEAGMGEFIPLLVLLTDRGWPMSRNEISTRIDGLAALERSGYGDDGAWWPRDLDDLDADLSALTELGLVEQTAGNYAGSTRWRATEAGQHFVRRPLKADAQSRSPKRA